MPLPEKVLGGLEQLARSRSEKLRARPSEGMGAMAAKRMEAARAPFEMAGNSPLKPIEIIANRSESLPRGQALDLSALGDWDLAHYKPLERKSPTTVSKRAEIAYSPKNVREFERYVRKGATEGGLEWYDMSPLSRIALQEMSPDDFRSLMAMNAAASARSGVDDQIKRASLAWYYKKQGIPWPMTNEELAKVASPGYGHLAHDIHSKHLGPLVRGEAPNFSSIDQPKYASYHEDFMGNMAPLTADTHYQALHGFPMKETYNKYNNKWIEAPDFSKNVDYPFAELFSGERARRMGIPLPMYQAAAWVGGKEATGVRDARPFTAVYDDLIGRTAQQLDISPTEALKKHLRGEIPLMPIERARGGLAMAGGGSPLSALQQYIRYKLPRQYATLPMRHLQSPEAHEAGDSLNSYWGSARDIFQLGDDKLVKIAKRPRGLREMQLEGEPGVAKNLPELHWRSPDNELAVVEKMKHDPEGASTFMGPLQDRFEFANLMTKTPSYRIHRSDREMQHLMQERGLEKFFPYDVHGPDFFSAPQHHWTMAPGRGGVLLDPGALDYRITKPDFERTLTPSFQGIADERLKMMLPGSQRMTTADSIARAMKSGDMRTLEPLGLARGVEDFIGPEARWSPTGGDMDLDFVKKLLPQQRSVQPQLSEGHTFDLPGKATGGMIEERVRGLRRMAGGGTVRNWLRGVKGSAIDEALARLKENYPHNPGFDRPDALPEIKQEAAKREALKKWIDTNLGNYIVKQHGTDNDPLTKHLPNAEGRLAAIMNHPAAVRKIPAAEIPGMFRGIHEGQGWYGYSKEDREKHLALPPWLQKLADQDAPRHWSQKQYDAALGSEEFNRVALKGNQGDTIAAAKAKDMETEARGKYMRRSAPKIELHDLEEQTWRRHYEPEMRNTLDYLSANVDPKDLFKVSVPDAVRKSKEWHAAMAKKAEEAAAVKLEGPGFKQYPSGWKWIEMGGNYDERGSAAFTAESTLAQQIGKQLGHCYQDYGTCRDYLENGKLYSLIDPKGKAHATLEASTRNKPTSRPLTTQLMNDLSEQHPGMRSEYEKAFAATGEHSMQYAKDFWPWLEKNYPDLHAKMNEDTLDLNQIRGPQNGKVVGEALPYVHDFIRSGKWGDIAEPKNAGLDEITSTTGKTHYMTPEEAKPFASEWPHHPRDAAGDLLPAPRQGRYVRGDNFVEYSIPDDWKPQGFAKGGAVAPMIQHADFPRESPDERLMRAQFQLQILKDELEQPDNTKEERAAIGREIQRTEDLIEHLMAAGASGQMSVKGDSLDSPGAVISPAGSSHEDASAGEGDDEEMRAIAQMLMGEPGEDDYMSQLFSESAA